MTYDYEKQRELERARNAEVRAKLVKVAEILKQPVKVGQGINEEPAYDCRVETPFFYLNFSAGYGKHRVEVRGNYPKQADGSYAGDIWYTQEEREARKAKGIPDTEYGKIQKPSITISPDKTAEQIAKDIQRRFLPDYLDYRKRLDARIKETDDYESRTKTNLETLKKAKLTDYEEKQKRFSGYAKKGCEGARYEVKVSGTDVDVELHNLTVDQAEEILSIIVKGKRG